MQGFTHGYTKSVFLTHQQLLALTLKEREQFKRIRVVSPELGKPGWGGFRCTYKKPIPNYKIYLNKIRKGLM